MDENTQLESPQSQTAAATSLEATICSVIAKELGVPVEVVERAGTLRETPGMESLRLLRAVTCVEKHFGVELEDEMVFSIQSVSELAEVVRSQLAMARHV